MDHPPLYAILNRLYKELETSLGRFPSQEEFKESLDWDLIWQEIKTRTQTKE